MLRAYGDGNLFGEPCGEAPVRVVWLHGWARSRLDFGACASELERRGIGSVALDLPGFGSSPLPTAAGGARHYAELIAPALAEMATEPLVLVGHSFGGRVAIVVAANHPELVRAVVLTGAPLIRPTSSAKSPWRYRLTRWLHAKGVVRDSQLEAARQRYGSADYRNARGLLREVLVVTVNESYEDELGRLVAPVAMVWGSDDGEVPIEFAQRASGLLHGTHTLRSVPGVGHLLPIEAPNELVATVLDVLA